MPRDSKPSPKTRHDPLLVQLDNDEHQVKYGRISEPGRRQKSSKNFLGDDENVEAVLDPKTSRRIFELARTQQDELDGLDEEIVEDALDEWITRIVNAEDEVEEVDGTEDDQREDAEEIFEIDPDDLETLDALLPHNIDERRTLADVIFSKLDENVGAIQKVQQKDRSRPDPALGLDPMVVEMYTKPVPQQI
ncbi:Bystin-domain-containing protein [Lentinula edodes]|uniref:Bystin-domain-containing protein n=1 Tax=Lentinula edodes TaxID=5353 RepID=A0A1Q3EN72_LENED|nr:Bystin-domain-containing protein [Lentinula edodes]